MNECWRCGTKTVSPSCPVCRECLIDGEHDTDMCRARHTNRAAKSDMVAMKKTGKSKMLVRENLFKG